MKAKELRDRTTEHLRELEKSVAEDLFQARFRTFRNRLNDTASFGKARRDLARLKTILVERAASEQAPEADGKA